MKKKLILIIVFIFLLSSCTSSKVSIDSSEYYNIYRNQKYETVYEIYNSDGVIVFSDTTTRPVKIKMVNNDIIDIGENFGTGIVVHKYYSLSRDMFSVEFTYVIANSNEYIAYIDTQKESTFETRKIIVQNIFDDNSYKKEIRVDFSEIYNPVISAEFSNNEKVLSITYLTGKDSDEITQSFDLD